MTAVTQTDAFNKLDESTLKDFIAKVINLLPQIGLSDSGYNHESVCLLNASPLCHALRHQDLL